MFSSESLKLHKRISALKSPVLIKTGGNVHVCVCESQVCVSMLAHLTFGAVCMCIRVRMCVLADGILNSKKKKKKKPAIMARD